MSLHEKMKSIFAKSLKKSEKRIVAPLSKRTKKPPVADVRAEIGPDGEPTTLALQKWTTAEFRNYFINRAMACHQHFAKAAEIRELMDVKRFITAAQTRCMTLYQRDVAPRSLLNLFHEAAKKLHKWRKEEEAKKAVGVWMIGVYADTIIDDLLAWLYSVDSIRHILRETVDSRKVEITTKENGNIVLTLDGENFLYFKKELEVVVKNPDLRARLGFDDAVYEDPDGTSLSL